MSSSLEKVTVISPAFKEEENLSAVAFKIKEVQSNYHLKIQWILVVNKNDPGTTPAIARELERKNDFITVETRQGTPSFGEAIKTGLKKVNGDLVVFMMSDMADNPAYIPKLVDNFEDGIDIVYGSRFLAQSKLKGYSLTHLVLNRFYNRLVKLIFGLNSADLTNAFKAYRVNAIENVGIKNLVSDGFEILIELPLKAHIEGHDHTEIPVDWLSRRSGKSRNTICTQAPKYFKRTLEILFYEYIPKKYYDFFD